MPILSQVRLLDGTAAVIRTILRTDAPRLAEGLGRLSPESRIRRFFYDKRRFSPAELAQITEPDASIQIALVLALVDSAGQERDAVAIARCIREKPGGIVGEIAITVVDEWRRKGIGQLLVSALAGRTWLEGVRDWRAVFLSHNHSMRRLLDRVGHIASEGWITTDCIEAFCVLRPQPAPGAAL